MQIDQKQIQRVEQVIYEVLSLHCGPTAAGNHMEMLGYRGGTVLYVLSAVH